MDIKVQLHVDVDDRFSGFVHDCMQRFENAEQERLLDEAQELVDQGVRLRDIVILERRGQYNGRRVVTKAVARLFEEAYSVAGIDECHKE